jgi:hypothetical protein
MKTGPRIGMQKGPLLPVPHQRPRAESFSSLQRTKIAIACLLSLASVEGKAPMNQFLVLACLALLHLAFASSARAESERSFDDERSFVGLWEGIDPVDGGDSLRSITCSTDQTCNLAVTDSVVTRAAVELGLPAARAASRAESSFSRMSCSPVRTARRYIWWSVTNTTCSTGRSWRRFWSVSAAERCRTSSFTRSATTSTNAGHPECIADEHGGILPLPFCAIKLSENSRTCRVLIPCRFIRSGWSAGTRCSKST